jgi:hypothetical protein
MKIRNGNYTIYNENDLKIFESRSETLISDEEKIYSICYESNYDLKNEGFEKYPSENMFCKGVYLKELANAYQVKTMGLFNGFIFQIFNVTYTIDNIVRIGTNKRNEFNSATNTVEENKNWYIYDIKISELEKLWEERTPTEYNLPMPEGLELYKEIEIPKEDV